MTDISSFAHIEANGTSIVFDFTTGHIELIYVGSSLSHSENLEALSFAQRRCRHEAQSDIPQPLSILPLSGSGYMGKPAIRLARQGVAIEPRFRNQNVEVLNDKIQFRLEDSLHNVCLTSTWAIDASGLVIVDTTVENVGTESFEVLDFASIALPLPHWATQHVRYSGRWAAEMHQSSAGVERGSARNSSYGGRTGFSGAQWTLLHEEGATSDSGRVLCCHLAWSGDAELTIERDNDGRSVLMTGIRFDPGEMSLSAGEGFSAPKACFHVGNGGRNGAMQAFHRHVLENFPNGTIARPRRIHLNSWEAFGFDYDLPRLMRLVDDASELGVERFVLDDGWFLERRDDKAGLGDWTPDPEIFPQGLAPLIMHVQSCGLDFGLWIEPEMVSPNSRLYREHPEWCISRDNVDRPTQRNQLLLDLTICEANAHVFTQIDNLLTANDISYLKWDHNRDMFPRSGKGISQTLALYELLDRLRCAHPEVEIESCASGGGRVDLEILKRCSRFWASDNNDAIERLKINRGWFQFLPLAATGNHVGPSPNPITGRRLSMDFRAKIAVFGHMGIETDPAAMSEQDRACLAQHIEIYKQWRSVLHRGQLSEIKCSDPNVYGWLCLLDDKAIALAAQTQFSDNYNAPPILLSGLPKEQRFCVRLLRPWRTGAEHRLNDAIAWERGVELSGYALAEIGLALPLTLPETAWLISLERIG
jgi:alpha-galactosidase